MSESFDDPEDDLYDDSEYDPDDEPIGSCDNCGGNVYPSDYSDGTLCDECEWKMEQL